MIYMFNYYVCLNSGAWFIWSLYFYLNCLDVKVKHQGIPNVPVSATVLIVGRDLYDVMLSLLGGGGEANGDSGPEGLWGQQKWAIHSTTNSHVHQVYLVWSRYPFCRFYQLEG